ncbi:hypothetical protein BY996DRAFT_4217199 [Phakopsora pachyrhizi]|nr:hypothetical protein BY996DRAFT_4217199 [Phakopsora pachyrhizi]
MSVYQTTRRSSRYAPHIATLHQQTQILQVGLSHLKNIVIIAFFIYRTKLPPEANTDAARKESKRRLGPSENLKISSSPKSPVIESKKLLPENIIDPNSNFTQGENFFNFSTDIETSGVKTRSQSSVILSDSSGSSHPLPFDKKATSSIQNPRTNIKSRAEGKPTVILRHDSPIVRHLKSFGKNVSSQRDNNPKSLTRSIFKDDTGSVNETERMIKQPMLKSPVRIDYGRTMNFKEFLDLGELEETNKQD